MNYIKELAPPAIAAAILVFGAAMINQFAAGNLLYLFGIDVVVVYAAIYLAKMLKL